MYVCIANILTIRFKLFSYFVVSELNLSNFDTSFFTLLIFYIVRAIKLRYFKLYFPLSFSIF